MYINKHLFSFAVGMGFCTYKANKMCRSFDYRLKGYIETLTPHVFLYKRTSNRNQINALTIFSALFAWNSCKSVATQMLLLQEINLFLKQQEKIKSAFYRYSVIFELSNKITKRKSYWCEHELIRNSTSVIINQDISYTAGK